MDGKNTIDDLIYQGSLRNLGFYFSEKLIGVASLRIRVINLGKNVFKKIGIVKNLILLEDQYLGSVLKHIEVFFIRAEAFTYYTNTDDRSQNRVLYWVKSINPEKIRNFRSLLHKSYKIGIPDTCLKLLANGTLIKANIYNMEQLIKIFSSRITSSSDYQIEAFSANQVSAYFLNKNPSIVTYLLDSYNLICFHKFKSTNSKTNKVVTIAKIELLIFNGKEKQERSRFKKLVDLVWQAENIDQIIFQDIPSFEILFSEFTAPYEEYIKEYRIRDNLDILDNSENPENSKKIDYIY